MRLTQDKYIASWKMTIYNCRVVDGWLKMVVLWQLEVTQGGQ